MPRCGTRNVFSQWRHQNGVAVPLLVSISFLAAAFERLPSASAAGDLYYDPYQHPLHSPAPSSLGDNSGDTSNDGVEEEEDEHGKHFMGLHRLAPGDILVRILKYDDVLFHMKKTAPRACACACACVCAVVSLRVRAIASTNCAVLLLLTNKWHHGTFPPPTDVSAHPAHGGDAYFAGSKASLQHERAYSARTVVTARVPVHAWCDALHW